MVGHDATNRMDENIQGGEKMTPNQNRALQALLTNPTKKAAAAAAGITEQTMCRYLTLPDFQAAYKKAFAALVNDATKQAQQLLSPALSALKTIVEDEDENSNTRISAARSLLEYGLKLTEFNDILQDLNEVE